MIDIEKINAPENVKERLRSIPMPLRVAFLKGLCFELDKDNPYNITKSILVSKRHKKYKNDNYSLTWHTLFNEGRQFKKQYNIELITQFKIFQQ